MASSHPLVVEPLEIDAADSRLTFRQLMFVNHLLGDARDQTDAARRAGYSNPSKMAYSLMNNAGVRAAIAARTRQFAMKAEEVLARETEVASASLEDFMSLQPDGKTWTVDLNKAKRLGKMHLLKKVRWTERGLEIEIQSAEMARDRLARYHGLYDDRLTVTHKVDLSQLPNTPEVLELLRRRSSGEIGDAELHAAVRSLTHTPSPTVIDGEGIVHDLEGGSV